MVWLVLRFHGTGTCNPWCMPSVCGKTQMFGMDSSLSVLWNSFPGVLGPWDWEYLESSR